MSLDTEASAELIRKGIAKTKRKKIMLQSYRKRQKPKRLLVSKSTITSSSSIFNDTSADMTNQTIDRGSSSPEQITHGSITMSRFKSSCLSDIEQSSDFDSNDETYSSDDSSSISSFYDNDSGDISNNFETNKLFADERPIHLYTQLTVREFSLDMLEFCRLSRLPKNQRQQLLEIFRKYFPSPNLVPSSSEALASEWIYVDGVVVAYSISIVLFSKCINKTGSVGIHKLHEIEKICGSCHSKLKNGRCYSNNCIHEDLKVPHEDLIEIVSFDIIEQIRLVGNYHLERLRQYQRNAREKTTSDQNDIVCGEVYQSLLKHHQDFFLSIMIHTDGVPLYKSKNASAWPILGAVIELPPYCRNSCENILLLGIWIAKRKPDFNRMFERLFDKLHLLKTAGIELETGNCVKVLIPMLMGDMPALSTMVRFVKPNAFYACMFCKSKGTYNHLGHCIIYLINESSELRSSNDFQKHAELASVMQPRIDREKTFGVKGISAFKNVLDVPLPHAVVIDSMHTVFLCHSKKLLLHLTSKIGKTALLSISKRMRSINYIHDVLRRPRSLSNLHKWKASEVRVFILYVGLPTIGEFLCEEECGDLALYIVILRLLHDHWNNEKQLYDSVSALLNLYVQRLSTKLEAEICPPNLLTITTHTQTHLPLQCRKFGRLDWLTNFVFESFLGYVKSFIRGSSGAGEQIAFAFESNFVLSKNKMKPDFCYGHFVIDENNFGSNVIKLHTDDLLAKFLLKHGHNSDEKIIFSRLHHLNTTYHSFLYTRKGATCSYLVSYRMNGHIEYGYVLCFFISNCRCFAVIQKLQRVNRSMETFFSRYSHRTAIKDFLDALYIFVKLDQPTVLEFDQAIILDVDHICSRCFSIPIETGVIVVTEYSCAFEHN